MRRSVQILAVLVALLCAPAVARGEIVRELPRHDPARCLRGAGAEQLTLAAHRTGRHYGTDLLDAGTLEPRAALAPADPGRCASVSAAGGRTLSAAPVALAGDRIAVRAALREADGTTQATTLRTLGGDIATSVTGAVGARGDAVVVWTESTFQPSKTRVYAAVRRPGGRFGPARLLERATGGEGSEGVGPVAAVTAAGALFAAWVTPRPDHGGYSELGRVRLAGARPVGGLRVRTLLGVQDARTIDLAASTDGHAVLVADGNDAVHVFDRAPGGAFHGRVAFGDGLAQAGRPTVAVRDGGGAVVAWRAGGDDGDVVVASRTGEGAFGRRQTVWRNGFPSDEGSSSGVTFGLGPGTVPDDSARDPLRATLDGAGRVALSWAALTRPGGDSIDRVFAVAGDLSGRFGAVRLLGSPCRIEQGVTPVPGAASRVAWLDEAYGEYDADAEDEIDSVSARVHLADLAIPARTSAAPRLTASAKPQALHAADPLHVTVRCPARCDVRGWLPSGGRDLAAEGGLTAPAGRSVRLAVFPDFDGVLGWRSERLRVHLRSCAADGTAAPPVVVPVDARKAKPFPFAVPTHVRAKRHGRKIAVTWRTRVTATHTSFDVAALAGGDFLDFQDVDGSGRRRYRATLTVPAHARVTRVTVYAYDARDDLSREVSARVR